MKIKSNISFIKITNYISFVNFIRVNNRHAKRFHFLRFKDGAYYYCLYKDGEILCDIWMKKESVFISEINKTWFIKKGYILLDGSTVMKFRGNGYFKQLLNNVIASVNSSELYSFALKNNVASNKGHLAVGFKKIRYNI